MKYISLFDTNSKEIKQIYTNKTIKIYNCGPTVYDYIHIGNARALIVVDVLYRFLKSLGNVEYVFNITDIDQKIIDKSISLSMNSKDLANQYIKALDDDMKYLNILSPTHRPLATDYIDEIISVISEILKLGYGYILDDGVYFNNNNYENIKSIFHNHSLDSLGIYKRIQKDQKSSDFVLWKFRSNKPYWNSPWGTGIPGWHTECCAMINKIFKNQPIDIHCGGKDLQFPHHENESLQYQVINKNEISNTWMHINFLSINDAKMSKSLNNVVQVKSLHSQYYTGIFRAAIIKSHYRSEMHFTYDMLNAAEIELNKLLRSTKDVKPGEEVPHKQFNEALANDFDTPTAWNILMHTDDIYKKKYCMNILGLNNITYQQWLYRDNDIEYIDNLVNLYKHQRNIKNYSEADAIREKMHHIGLDISYKSDDSYELLRYLKAKKK